MATDAVGDQGVCTTKCIYKDSVVGWVCDTHSCVKEAALSVTVQESGTSSRIINIPLKKGTNVLEGEVLTFSTATGEKDDLNDVAVSGGILPPEYRITVGRDRKLNIFLKSNPKTSITEYVEGLRAVKTANNSTIASARKNAEDAKTALAAAQKQATDATAEATAALAANVSRLTKNAATAQGISAEERARAAATEESLQAQVTALEAAASLARAGEQAAMEELRRAQLDHANELAREKEKLDTELFTARESLANEMAGLDAAKATVADLTAKLAAAPTPEAKAAADAELAAAKAEITQLTGTVAEKQGEIERHAGELEEVNQELETAKRTAAEDLAKITKDASAALDEANEELDTIRREKVAADAQIADMTTEKESIAAQLAAARVNAATSASAREQVAELERRMANIQDELTDANTKAEIALAQEQSAREAAEQAQQDADARIAAAEEANQEQMAVLSREKNAALSNSAAKQEAINQLTANLDTAKQRTEDAAKAMQQIQDNIRAAEAERTAALANAARATDEEKAAMRAATAASQMQIQRLEQEKTAAAASLEAAQIEAAAAQESVRRLSVQPRPSISVGVPVPGAVEAQLKVRTAELERANAIIEQQNTEITTLRKQPKTSTMQQFMNLDIRLNSSNRLLKHIIDVLASQKMGGITSEETVKLYKFLDTKADVDVKESYTLLQSKIDKLLSMPVRGGRRTRTIKKRNKNRK